ncbi:MAG TPA: carboxypeptidase-like regulatory domain-containing protein [Chitinophagaceae bacterium]|nr:carboxypeptidase-like regulatory domain-containing protein [Chitinophagaceae bacterium]
MSKITSTFILSLICFSVSVSAQLGKIAGKVKDLKTNEPLAGASIIIKGQAKGISTSVEGTYLISMEPGIYTLLLSYSGYQSKVITEVEVKTGLLTEIDIGLEVQSREMSAVVLTSSARKESINTLYNLQRTQAGMSDGVASDIIKKSPDRNTGAVLKRVSGASVQENKFVVVRGLADRYNGAMINNSVLPSSEPDRKAFSFDIIPSSLVDNIIINKTASPDLPGDFSGGMVQVNTKDVPSKNFFSLGAGLGVNTQTTFREFKSGVKGNYDFLGFDDGTRNMPSSFPQSRTKYNSASSGEQVAFSKMFDNHFGLRKTPVSLPAQNIQLTFGNRKELSGESYFGTVLSLTYQHIQSINESNRKDYESAGITSYEYGDVLFKNTTNLGALANFSLVKGKSKISLKNLFNRTFENTFTTRSGFNYDNDQAINLENGTTANDLLIKTLISSQLEGEHRLGKNNQKLNWNFSFSNTNRDQPDLAVISFFRPISSPLSPYSVILRPQNTFRFFSNLDEHATGANINYSLPFIWNDEKQTFKAGYSGQNKTREFQTRFLTYKKSPYGTFNENLLTLPPDKIFNKENINADGFIIEDITSNTDRYHATSMLNAGYALLDNRFTDKLRLLWGIRVENFNQEVNTRDLSGRMVAVSNKNFDVLPSASFTFSFTRKQNLKLALSQTVSRPEFRELANFSYYDFVTNSSIIGNPDLQRSLNTNADIRFEIFPKAGEIVSVSAFYKNFKNPIEQAILSGSVPSNRIRTFINSDQADTYGAELEIRKQLSFLGEKSWLENTIVYANMAIIKSAVNIASLNLESKERPLQGQSPYLINAGILYNTIKNGLAFSLLYNRTGERIADVGFAGYPDIYERARDILDFQVGKQVGKKGELKLNLSDMLNQKTIFYQNLDNKKVYNKKNDQVVNDVKYGASISVAYTYNFK